MCTKLIAVLVICGLVLSGCQVDTRERVLMRHDSSKPADVRQAPYHGQYRLYAGAHATPTTQSATPILTGRLEKGDPIGFSRDASGRLSAVVRGTHTELKPGAYAWTMQADSGQIDPGKTTALVVAIVVVVGIAVGVAVAAASSSGWLSGLNVGALGGG